MSNAQTLCAELAAKEQEVAAKQLEVAALRKQVAAALTAAREEVISELLEKILANNIVVGDLFPEAIQHAPTAAAAPGASRTRKTVEPKYRNPETSATWTGRGKAPTWLAGKDKAQFLIVAPTEGPATGDSHKPAGASALAVTATSTEPHAVSTPASVNVQPVAPATEPAPHAPVCAASDNARSPTLPTREEATMDPIPSASNAEADSRAASLAFGSAGEVTHDGPTQDPAATLKAVALQ